VTDVDDNEAGISRWGDGLRVRSGGRGDEAQSGFIQLRDGLVMDK